MKITAKMVRNSMSDDDPWRLGNQVLYDLCQQHPHHVDDAAIVAKVWLIGRAYSASIERGKGDTVGIDVPNDVFYTKHVAAVLRESKLDEMLDGLSGVTEVNAASIKAVLKTHGYLVKLFRMLTSRDKRSLASKYLHFHYPNLFFIYDSRAASGIRTLALPRQSDRSQQSADPEYAKFVSAALSLRERVSSEFDRTLSPRQLDRLLLAAFASA